MTLRPLGRLTEDVETPRAIELYPFELTVDSVERSLSRPGWLYSHDQGSEGSCVGHAVALERGMTNTLELPGRAWRRYDPIAIWRAAKAVDEWSFTKPEDANGTSVRAAYEIARSAGLVRVRTMKLEGDRPTPIHYVRVGSSPSPRTVDSVRAAIGAGVPVVIGVEWLTGFDSPTLKGRERWLPLYPDAGRSRGGHAVTLTAASDRRQAVLLCNSWGRDYPPTWMPYETLSALLSRRGEAALVTDRLNV